jgi:hypothetical protein
VSQYSGPHAPRPSIPIPLAKAHTDVFDVLLYATLDRTDLLVSDPMRADVFYLPIPLLLNPVPRLTRFIVPFMVSQGIWHNRNLGVDHIFVHPVFAMRRTFSIDDREVELHPFSITIPDIPWSNSSIGQRYRIKFTIIPYHSNFLPNRNNTERTISIFFIGCINPTFVPPRVVRHGQLLRERMFPLFENLTDSKLIRTWRWVKTKTHRGYDIAGLQCHSVFCAVPHGDSPSSKRLFDAFRTGCIPIVISDQIRFPLEQSFLQFENLVIQISMYDLGQIEHVMMLANDRWQRIYREAMEQVDEIFNLSVTAELKRGEQTWAWLWAEYIKQCYVAATKRIQPEGCRFLKPFPRPRVNRRR